jgi:hypothetical protein
MKKAEIIERSKGQVITVVLGFHRSGTSMTAHILSVLGVTMGDDAGKGMLIGNAVENQKGYWEDEDFLDLSSRLMTRAGGGWDNPPSTDRLMNVLKSKESVEPMIEDLLAKKIERGHPRWGWKDPRTVITWPLYAPYLPNARIVRLHRKPEAAVNSLLHRERNNMAVQKAMYLYTDAQVRMDRHVIGRQVFDIDYDVVISSDREAQRALITALAVFARGGDMPSDQIIDEALTVIDPNLNRSGYTMGAV